jgi:asparagine synthase (glutamine-hydrolysing)
LGYFYNTDTSGEVGPYFSSPRAGLAFALLRQRFAGGRRAAQLVEDRFASDLSRLPASLRDDKKKLMHYLQLRFTLPFVLDRTDRLSAAHSLEVRVPYCDHRLVEYVFGLDETLTYTEPEKKLLRDSFVGRIDERVLWRRKSVFPFAEDEAQLEALRSEACRILTAARREGGLLAEVYRLPLLRAVLSPGPLFRRMAAGLGSFYVQAFLCQLISLHELEQAYGLRAPESEPVTRRPARWRPRRRQRVSHSGRPAH